MKSKLKTKDLIYAGAFCAMYLVFAFVISSALGMVPLLYLCSPIFIGLFAAPIFSLYVAKVPKFGAVLILSIILSIAMSSGWLYSVIVGAVVGIVSELLIKAGSYKSKSMYFISYVLMSFVHICLLGMFIFGGTAAVDTMRVRFGDEYADAMSTVTEPWILGAIVIASVVSCAVGMLIAGRMMKKHFERAGIA